MSELFLDVHTMFRFAVAMRARQEILDHNGTPEAAAAAFKSKLHLDYDPKWGISALEEHPNLNEHLINFLEAEIKVRTAIFDSADDRATAIQRRDDLWESYEVLRRMTAFDSRSLLIEKFYLVP